MLAPGNPSIGAMGWPDNEHFISDFWAWRLAGGRLPVDSNDPVLIVGTGLTAIDAIASCRLDGFTGPVLALSPRGRWPAMHEDPVTPYKNADALIASLKDKATALHYFRAMRKHTEANNWRSVIDSVRPHVTGLWQKLPEKEKARFMRHLWSLWNIHRHRIAPEAADIVKNVSIIAARVTGTSEDGTVILRHRGGAIDTFKAFRVINCTGPSYRTMVRDNPLLSSLMSQDFLEPGPLGLGVASPTHAKLHVIGTPLLGERLETTAVPELRAQAAAIAAKII